jgi:hypothetical protein
LQNVEEGDRSARRRLAVGKAARRLAQKVEEGIAGSHRKWRRAPPMCAEGGAPVAVAGEGFLPPPRKVEQDLGRDFGVGG